MTQQLLTFPDFHIHGASAPEWNQRYLQMSPGVMRSSLLEWSAVGVHVFGKWMSERVVQQGGLPRGQICLALLGKHAPGHMRVQGREFGHDDLFLLRGGEEFEFHRPAAFELLSVTFDAAVFAEHLEVTRAAAAQRNISSDGIHRPDGALLNALRRTIRAQLTGTQAFGPRDLMQLASNLIGSATKTAAQRASSIASARVVKACQKIVGAAVGERPPRIEELCARVGVSRRSLQNGFRSVTGTSPLVYLRNLRLNTVRRRLMSTPAGAPSVSEAACEAGFDHLGHFAAAYKALFGETPSQTGRSCSIAPTERNLQSLLAHC